MGQEECKVYGRGREERLVYGIHGAMLCLSLVSSFPEPWAEVYGIVKTSVALLNSRDVFITNSGQ